MTFKEFQESRRPATTDEIEEKFFQPTSIEGGWIYAEVGAIECYDGLFYMPLCRDEYLTADLEWLERELFRFIFGEEEN